MGNWPGKTVEKKDGTYSYNNEKYKVVDLPGSYGLSGNSDEEIITERFIKSGEDDFGINVPLVFQNTLNQRKKTQATIK